MIACAQPEQRWREPEALQSGIIIGHVAQVTCGWQDAMRADHAFDLEKERVERGKIDDAQAAEEDPARQQMCTRTFSRGFRPQQPFGGLSETRHFSSGGL